MDPKRAERPAGARPSSDRRAMAPARIERPQDVLLALGANMGDRQAHLRRGVAGLARVGEVRAASAVYESTPVGYVQQGPFLNAAVWLRTGLGSLRLLMWCKSLEFAAGRRPGVPQGPRPLDIDIVSYAGARETSARLRLPHPRVFERPFVLAPLSDIAPQAMLPGSSRTIRELSEQLGRDGIVHVATADLLWSAE